MFRFTKYKPSVLKTLEQTCSETHFRIKASNLSQTIFKDLSVLADRKKFFPPVGRRQGVQVTIFKSMASQFLSKDIGINELNPKFY